MDDGHWIVIDKRVINLFPRDRAFTFIEALISLTVDINNKRKNSINGYSKIWCWSRNKTRKFVNGLRTGNGHIVDRKGTSKGHEIRLIDKNLQVVEDTSRTVKGHIRDKKKDTTIKTKIKKNKKKYKHSLFTNKVKNDMTRNEKGEGLLNYLGVQEPEG